MCQFLQRWCDDRLLKQKEATALAEEDYELAETLSRQLDTTRVEPEEDIVSAGLIEVSIRPAMRGTDYALSADSQLD